MIYLTYCMLFLTLVLLLPFVLSDNTEDVYILLAAPSDVAPGLVLGDKMPSSMREITIPGNPCEDILVNNIHALITKGLGADKSSIAGVNWDVKDTDKIFGWKGVAGGTIEISLPKSNSGVYNSVEISLEENQTPHVYMLTCHTDPCSVNRSLLKDWKTKLRTMFNNNANVVFAELLDNWMQRPSSEDEDPWNTLDKSKQKRVLDVERDIRKAEVSKALTIWESHEKKCQEDANENIKDALDSLAMLRKKQKRLDSIGETWENSRRVEMLKKAEEAGDAYRIDGKLFSYIQQQVYALRAQQHDHVAAAVDVAGTKTDTESWKMQAMGKMWEQLYQQQKQGMGVHKSLSILIEAGVGAFNWCVHVAQAMREEEKAASQNGSMANALQAKLKMLSTAVARQGLKNTDDLSEDKVLESDDVARNLILTSLREDINANKSNLSVVENFEKKLMTVFGAAAAEDVPSERKTNDKAVTTLEDMVRFVKLRGIEILKMSTETIKKIKLSGTRLEKTLQNLKTGKIPLAVLRNERDPRSIQGYVDWMFLYPQMSFAAQPANEQSDAVYCLLVEALKGVFAAGDDWDASKWTCEKLPNSVGVKFPHFVAYNVLKGQLVPRFVAEYCQSQMEVVAGPTPTISSNEGDEIKSRTGGHDGALDTKDSSQPQAKQETQDSAKPLGTQETQNFAKPQGTQEQQGGGAPKRPTVETLKMLMCTTASVVLCTVVIIYAYIVVVLEAGVYAR
eukprot:GHVS01023106.1.p1 GENE.GHVS01023106.1~~GHVS01023106.1.p1  ORF type:complete len:735 (-),score=111.98 GHVS01023106.1:344-2548(-)